MEIVVINDWLNTVEGLANLNNWPFNFRLQFARSYMYGLARKWYDSKKFVNWNDFLSKFCAIFTRTTRLSD